MKIIKTQVEFLVVNQMHGVKPVISDLLVGSVCQLDYEKKA